MNKRWLSIVLIFSMLLSYFPSFNINTYADDTTVSEKVYEKTVSDEVYKENGNSPYEGEKIRVRVEGKDQQLYDEEVTVTDEVYGIDLLKTAIGEDNIVGTESSFGLLIEGIKKDGNTESVKKEEAYSTNWGIYVEKNGELKRASTGISSLLIGDIKELLIHKKAIDSSWSDLTYIPKLQVEQQGNTAKFKVKKIISAWGQPDKEENIESATLEINGKEYTTDGNGEVSIQLPEGAYDVKVSKDGESYPQLVRRTFKVNVEYPKIRVRVEGKNKTLYADEVKVTTEKTALEILKKAIGEENIEGKESQYGFSIKTILGERADYSLDNGAYWGLYTAQNGETKPGELGPSSLEIHGLDEVLFHVVQSTTLPILEYQKDGQQQKIIIKAAITEYDENWNPNTTIKRVEGTTLEIDGKNYVTDHNGEAIVELPEGDYIVNIFKKNSSGNYVELIRCTQRLIIGNKSIKIISELDLLAVGKTLKITGKVLDEDNQEISGETVKWYSSNKSIATVDENTGIVTGIKEGKVTITAKIQGSNNLTASIDLMVQEQKKNKEKIKEAVDGLRVHYSSYPEEKKMTFREVLGYKATSNETENDLAFIKEKYENISGDTAIIYAKNIMGALAVGEEYEEIVPKLVNAQKENGKFIVAPYDDYASNQSFCIVALDMANADYKVEDAVKVLISSQNENGSFGPWKDIDTTSMCLLALGNHRDIEGVNNAISKATQNILTLMKDEKQIDIANQYTLSAVIQGLIAVGENPLSEKWIIENKTMLNVLFKYKDGHTFGQEDATEQVFLALTDLYNKKSMYTGTVISNEGYEQLFIPVKEDDTGDGEIEDGDKATISVEGANNKYIISKREVDLEKRDTVFSVTKRILDSSGISSEDDDGYFVKINGLGEKDKGIKSGWMYNVNGVTILENAKDCRVNDGDKIEWYYTLDFTSDKRNSNKMNDEIKDELDKQIDEAKNVLNNKNASESEVTKAVKDITDELNKQADEIKSKEDAKNFVKDIKDIAEVMRKAAERIKTEDGAKNLANESVNVVKVLSKTIEKLKEDGKQKDIDEAAAENMKTILKVMDKIKDVKEMNQVATDMLEAAGVLMKDIGKEHSKEIKEKAIEIAEKAVSLAGLQTIEKNQLKTDEDKIVATVDGRKMKDLSNNLAKTAKEMKESLDKNNLEHEGFEKKLTIAVANDTNKEVEVNLPSNMIKIIKENGVDKVQVKTQTAVFNVTPKTFGEQSEDKEIGLSAKEIDRSELSALARYKIPKDSVIVDLNAKLGQAKVSKFEEPIEITIPYEVKAQEEKEVKVFFLNDNGMIEEVGGEYDSTTKTITFKTSHFSKYFAKQVDKETKKVFTDIKGNDWAKEAIETMAAKGIINGRTDKTFDPAANITRAEFATLVTKMMGYSNENMNVPFKDLSKDAWYYSYVGAAYKNGLINGRSEEVFDPNGNITRQEMAVIVSKVLEEKGYNKASLDKLNIFKDTQHISSWAKDSVSLCVKENIISGMGNGIFAPKKNANRAQVAVILYKVYELIK